MVTEMIMVGEETGQTVDILKNLADFFEESVSNFTKNFSTIIEPALMILIGVAVGFFVLAIIQPMFSIYSTF
jgi:type IV pilus assembly protein PilC